MEDTFQLFWRDSYIGTFSDFTSDMWYLEGTWAPNSTEEAKLFASLISKFRASDVMQNPAKGTRLVLKSADSDKPINALAISLTENKLFIRQITDEKAVQWLIKNVN